MIVKNSKENKYYFFCLTKINLFLFSHKFKIQLIKLFLLNIFSYIAPLINLFFHNLYFNYRFIWIKYGILLGSHMLASYATFTLIYYCGYNNAWHYLLHRISSQCFDSETRYRPARKIIINFSLLLLYSKIVSLWIW
jgi:hypothetical protein